MNNNDLKALVADMKKRVGRSEALRLMVVAGVSPHTGMRLLGESYRSEIGTLVGRAIVQAHEASKKIRASG